MDRRSLERLGHHVVSRRVALGYRNRTDLADSLQFTVRTLADIEHGVRKASPGTYAMLENKLAWAPGSIDTILAGGEPKEVVVDLRRSTQAPPRYPAPPPTALSARVHRGVVAGATTPHHRPPSQTPRHLGRLGRPGPTRRQGWPRPPKRLARTRLAAPTISGGAGDHAGPDAGLGCPRSLILPGQSPLGATSTSTKPGTTSPTQQLRSFHE